METTWLTIAQWMLRAGVGGGAILAVTLLAMRRVKQPARRQRLGEAGLLAALALAVLAVWPAWIPIRYGAAETPRVDFDIAVLTAMAPAEQVAPSRAATAPAAAPFAESVTQPPRAWPDGIQPALAALVALYAGGAAIFLTRWLLGLIGLRRLIRASTPAEAALLGEFAGYVPTRRLPRLLVSRRVKVPISCGILRPTVILPVSLAIDDQRERRAWLFAHELTHLERRDAWSCLLFALGQVVFFPVPWFWRLQRDVRLCQEYVADAAAVSAAGAKERPADEYASFLLTLTTSPVAPRVATGVSGSTSDLYRRVTMLLENPLRVEKRCPAWWTAGAAGALVGLAVFGAGVGLAQAPPNQREVMEQLDRIQEMVNKLRRQMADSQTDAAATTEDARRDEVKKGTFKVKDTAKQATADAAALERLIEANVLLNRRAAEQQKAAADAAKHAQDRHVLDAWIRGRVEETAKKPATERAELIRRLFLDLRGTLPSADELKKYLDTPPDLLIRMLNDTVADGTSNTIAVQTWADLVRPSQDAQLKQALDLLKAYRDQLEKQPPASKEEVQKRLEEVIDRLNKALQPRTRAALRLANPNIAVWGAAQTAPRGRLGVRLDQPSDILREQLNLPEGRGLVIVEVFDGSVAKKAGIQVNDILLKLGDTEVESDAEKVAQAVTAIKADSKVDIVVLRRGKPTTIQGVQLPAPPDQGVVARLVGKRPQITVTLHRGGDDAFIARRQEGAIQFTVEASVRDGKTQVRKIEIAEGGRSREFTRLDDVPVEHRAKVEQLIRVIGSLSSSSVPLHTPQGVLFLDSGDGPIQLEGSKLLREPAHPHVIRLEGNVITPSPQSLDLEFVIPKQDRK
jgi:beta-lactamase regulating signal transducer with metallopeptidase domain